MDQEKPTETPLMEQQLKLIVDEISFLFEKSSNIKWKLNKIKEDLSLKEKVPEPQPDKPYSEKTIVEKLDSIHNGVLLLNNEYNDILNRLCELV